MWDINTEITKIEECYSLIQWMRYAISKPQLIPRNGLKLKNEIHTFLLVMRSEIKDFWREFNEL